MTDLLNITSTLAPHGIKAKLERVGTSNRWIYTGELKGQGVVVQLEGSPDQAVIDQAAQMIVSELCQH